MRQRSPAEILSPAAVQVNARSATIHDLRTPPVSCRSLAADARSGLVDLGTGGSAGATLLCGWFHFDAEAMRALAHLLPWTLDALAAKAKLSRSAFAGRFRRSVGRSPLAYLTRWRMVKAGQLLRREGLSLGEVAAQVGYESESAFSKAFKREMGAAPGAWRRSETPTGALAA